jgi:hypothetical protein
LGDQIYFITKDELYNDTKWVFIDEETIRNSTEAQHYRKKNTWYPTKARIIVSPWNVCTSGQGKDLDILFYVFNRVTGFEHRNYIRQTYANRTRYPTANFVFVLGSSADPIVNLKIVEENKRFGDIIQGDFIDAYRNLSFKSLIQWRWTIHNCLNARYFAKIDDDVYVNTRRVLYLVRNKTLFNPEKRSFSGQIFVNSGVLRGTQKFGVTFGDWPEPTYRTYANGPAYVSKLVFKREKPIHSNKCLFLQRL